MDKNDKNKLPAFYSWTYYNDGSSDPPPLPKSTQTPTEHPKYDYDKLIAESTGLYKDWWIMWKRLHPEWALIKKDEPIIKPPPKHKPVLKQLTCKRCNHTWTPRSKNPPMQCPKC